MNIRGIIAGLQILFNIYYRKKRSYNQIHEPKEQALLSEPLLSFYLFPLLYTYVHCKINTKLISPNTKSAVYLVDFSPCMPLQSLLLHRVDMHHAMLNLGEILLHCVMDVLRYGMGSIKRLASVS